MQANSAFKNPHKETNFKESVILQISLSLYAPSVKLFLKLLKRYVPEQIFIALPCPLRHPLRSIPFP